MRRICSCTGHKICPAIDAQDMYSPVKICPAIDTQDMYGPVKICAAMLDDKRNAYL